MPFSGFRLPLCELFPTSTLFWLQKCGAALALVRTSVCKRLDMPGPLVLCSPVLCARKAFAAVDWSLANIVLPMSPPTQSGSLPAIISLMSPPYSRLFAAHTKSLVVVVSPTLLSPTPSLLSVYSSFGASRTVAPVFAHRGLGPFWPPGLALLCVSTSVVAPLAVAPVYAN